MSVANVSEVAKSLGRLIHDHCVAAASPHGDRPVSEVTPIVSGVAGHRVRGMFFRTGQASGKAFLAGVPSLAEVL